MNPRKGKGEREGHGGEEGEAEKKWLKREPEQRVSSTCREARICASVTAVADLPLTRRSRGVLVSMSVIDVGERVCGRLSVPLIQ